MAFCKRGQLKNKPNKLYTSRLGGVWLKNARLLSSAVRQVLFQLAQGQIMGIDMSKRTSFVLYCCLFSSMHQALRAEFCKLVPSKVSRSQFFYCQVSSIFKKKNQPVDASTKEHVCGLQGNVLVHIRKNVFQWVQNAVPKQLTNT